MDTEIKNIIQFTIAKNKNEILRCKYKKTVHKICMLTTTHGDERNQKEYK